jgi:PiT family inorganic phosphate transporter
MMVGALGIALGLSLYGPKLIRTVGSEITELNKIRAFCVAMAAAITVIIASQLGLPVSSTHIAVGGVFGVGFLREYLKRDELSIEGQIMEHHIDKDPEEVAKILAQFAETSIEGKHYMLQELKANSKKGALTKAERKKLNKIYKTQLVKRSQLLRIAAAWVITVPASALMAALLFFMIKGMMMP